MTKRYIAPFYRSRSVPGSKRGISWTDIYLRKEYQAVADLISTQPGGVYPLLGERCGEVVETIEMEISASRFPPHVARFLGYEDSDPALLLIRTFRNQSGKVMEVGLDNLAREVKGTPEMASTTFSILSQQEAVESSQIEGTRTGLEGLLIHATMTTTT